ncbi:MAG: CCE_0567 family metalloprotein [Terracidiphilus sp.]
MTDLEAIKAEVKKLSSQAVTAKMNLHDLAEDLPINWEQIPLVAQRAHDTYRELESKRAILKAAGA